MIDLKAHALHGKEFHLLRGPLLWLVLLIIVGLTAGSFFLNAVFAFAISKPGAPQIRPAFADAKRHLRAVLAWGLGVGLVLGFATMVVDRWGQLPDHDLGLGVAVASVIAVVCSIGGQRFGVWIVQRRRERLVNFLSDPMRG